MENQIFQRIISWNKERNNTEFNYFNEVRMIAEELYELCLYNRTRSKTLGLSFANEHANSLFNEGIESSDMNRDAMIDALGDIIYIATGTLYKLGADPFNTMSVICDANDKKGNVKDQFGKIMKDETFMEPVHVSV